MGPPSHFSLGLRSTLCKRLGCWWENARARSEMPTWRPPGPSPPRRVPSSPGHPRGQRPAGLQWAQKPVFARSFVFRLPTGCRHPHEGLVPPTSMSLAVWQGLLTGETVTEDATAACRRCPRAGVAGQPARPRGRRSDHAARRGGVRGRQKVPARRRRLKRARNLELRGFQGAQGTLQGGASRPRKGKRFRGEGAGERGTRSYLRSCPAARRALPRRTLKRLPTPGPSPSRGARGAHRQRPQAAAPTFGFRAAGKPERSAPRPEQPRAPPTPARMRSGDGRNEAGPAVAGPGWGGRRFCRRQC